MNATDILKERGLKKSAQRIAAINILQKNIVPLAEEDIRKEMGEIYDRVTFYRTMQALCKAGIAHRIVVDNTVVKYAINTEEMPHSHVHFYCTKCHSVTCLKEVATYHYKLPVNYRQEECDVLIKGTCPYCIEEPR